jgi:acyl carrier protein
VSELDTRLSALFRATFPDLDAQNLADVTRDSVAGWDSIAVMTLFALIEEEFGERFDLEEAAEWTSYAQIRGALESRLRGR